jgi:parallel beta-helix repeat protein
LGLYSPFRIASTKGSTVRSINVQKAEIGVRLQGGSGHIVMGCYLGTDLTGSAPGGVRFGIDANGSDDNTISNNVVLGSLTTIALTNSHGNRFAGNRLNLNAAGTDKIGATETGVFFNLSNDNEFGQAGPAGRNWVVGATNTGILVNGAGNRLVNAYVGVNGGGTAAIGSAIGVALVNQGVQVGGPNPGQGCIIAGSGVGGIVLAGDGGHVLEGNDFGRSVTGGDLGNLAYDLFLLSSNNTIRNNRLWYSGKGIVSPPGSTYTGNEWIQNSISRHDALGIDLLDDGPTAPPITVIQAVKVNPNRIWISAQLQGKPDTQYINDFFTDDQADPSGYGEGRRWFGSHTATTDSAGAAAISALLDGSIEGNYLTATTTESATRTSREFSNWKLIVDDPTFQTPTPGSSVPTSTRTPTPTPTPTLTPVPTTAPEPLHFYPVAPCRIVDTRAAAGPYGGPALVEGADRTFVITGHCGVPEPATAVAVNVTVVGSSGAGNLRIYPSGTARPGTSNINWRPFQTRANNAVVSLGGGGDVNAFSTTAANLVIDVTGYFAP